MVIDPWLLSEFLLETGAYSSIIEDAAKGSKEEVSIAASHHVEALDTDSYVYSSLFPLLDPNLRRAWRACCQGKNLDEKCCRC